ncbi:MAG: hypothetical protein AMXMBFR84_34500 [Candidatus Hydrogenedentota bacterium]
MRFRSGRGWVGVLTSAVIWTAAAFAGAGMLYAEPPVLISDPSKLLTPPVGRALPDIAPTSISYQSSSTTEGSSFSVTLTVKNQGTVSAGASHVALYFSLSSSDFNASGKYTPGTKPVPALNAGVSTDISWTFTVPDLSSGTYSLFPLVVVDSANEVPESAENNTFIATPGISVGNNSNLQPNIRVEPLDVVIDCTNAGGQPPAPLFTAHGIVRGESFEESMAVFDASIETMAWMKTQTGTLHLSGMPLLSGEAETFLLKPFEVFPFNAKVVEFDGTLETPIGRPDMKFYMGVGESNPDRQLYISVTADNEIRGMVWEPGLPTAYIMPSGTPRGDAAPHVLSYAEARPDDGTYCGTDLVPENDVVRMAFDEAERTAGARHDLTLEAEMLVDVNNALYNGVFGGSSAQATNYVGSLFGAVSAIYLRDVNVVITVKQLVIWTSSDPFGGADSLAQLVNYRSYNTNNRSNVERDSAHLLAHQTSFGGIAYLDTLCDDDFGYGVSNIFGNFSFPVTGYAWDVDVCAHEIGHTFGSPHTHCYNPPIDCCYTQECNCGSQTNIVGTIMSYCHLLGSNNKTLDFHSRTKTVLRSGAEDAPCLTIASGASGTFLIHNDGLGRLNVTSIAPDAASSWLSIAPSPPFNVITDGVQPVFLNVDCDAVPSGVTTRRILVNSNSPSESPYPGGVNLTVVNGAADPIIQVLPGSHDFGDVQVGQCAQHNFTVKNVGGGTLSGTASVQAPFSIFSGATYSLGAGQSQTVVIRFCPTATGAFSRNASFTGGGGASVPLSGDGVAVPVPRLLVSPPTRVVGQTAGSTTFDVANAGNGTLSWTASVTSGQNFANITAGAAGTNAGTISVSFSANASTASRTATIRVTAAGAEDSPQDVTIEQAGTALLTVTPPLRLVTNTATSTTFGVLVDGGPSVQWQATVQTGVSFLSISSGNAGTGSGTVNVTVQANNTASQRSGTIRVTAAGVANSPVDVTVTQEASSPDISVSPTGLTFDQSTPMPAASPLISEPELADRVEPTVLLESQVAIRIHVERLVAAGLDGESWTVHKIGNGMSSYSLRPHESSFDRLSTIVNSDPVLLTTVGSSASDSATVNRAYEVLTGIVTEGDVLSLFYLSPETPEAAVETLTFETGVLALNSGQQVTTVEGRSLAPKTFTVSNTGLAPLTVSSMSLDTAAPWISWSPLAPFNVAPGSSQVVTVTLSQDQVPQGTSQRRLRVFSNDLDESPFPNAVDLTVIATTGTLMSVAPTNHDYGVVGVGEFEDHTFVVSNNGTGTLAGSAFALPPYSIVSGGTYSLGAGASQNVVVRFAPTGAQTFGSNLTFTGGQGITVPVTGQGDPYLPVIQVQPSSHNVGPAATTRTIDVSNGGGGALQWQASVLSGVGLSIQSGASGTNTGTITVAIQANDTTSNRSGAVRITATGASNTPVDVPINQDGRSQVQVSPANRSLGSGTGSTTFSVSNAGVGNMSWAAAVIEGADWLSITAGDDGVNSGTISLSLAENFNPGPRTGKVRVTGQDALGSPFDVTVTQAGKARLNVDPLSRTVSSPAGTTTVAISNTGDGSLSWQAQIISGQDWLSLPAASLGTAPGVLSIGFNAMTQSGDRVGTVRITGTNALNSPLLVTVTQKGCIAPTTPTGLQASDGTFGDFVRVTWNPVSGASAYQVFRGEGNVNNPNQALVIGQLTGTLFDDYSALSPIPGGGCGGAGTPVVHTYFVRAMNDCSTSAFTAGEPGFSSGAKALSVFEKALPAEYVSDGTRAAGPGTPLALRVRADEPIDPASVWGEIGGTAVDDNGLTWQPIEGTAGHDGWVIFDPQYGIAPGMAVEFVAGASTVSGMSLEPTRMTFLIGAAETSTDTGEVQLAETGAFIPHAETGIGPIYELSPKEPFQNAHRILLPIPREVEPSSVGLAYYFESEEERGWFAADKVEGWLVPGTLQTVATGDQYYLSAEVRHGGTVQLTSLVTASPSALVHPQGWGSALVALVAFLVLASLGTQFRGKVRRP